MDATGLVAPCQMTQTPKHAHWNNAAFRKCELYTCECNLTLVHCFLYLTWDFDRFSSFFLRNSVLSPLVLHVKDQN